MPSGKAVGRAPFDRDRHGKDKHHVGFNDALEDALDRLSHDVGTGTYNVTVQFEAEVEVTNPGKITGYTVTIQA